jgi:hypothetical protein
VKVWCRAYFYIIIVQRTHFFFVFAKAEQINGQFKDRAASYKQMNQDSVMRDTRLFMRHLTVRKNNGLVLKRKEDSDNNTLSPKSFFIFKEKQQRRKRKRT